MRKVVVKRVCVTGRVDVKNGRIETISRNTSRVVNKISGVALKVGGWALGER